MKRLTLLIIKYPINTLLIATLLVFVSAIGITQVNLNTGNDTLISDATEIYQDNEDYQMEFGKDPIVVLVESENPFDLESMQLLHDMHEAVKDLDGVFAINSPVTLIEQMTTRLYLETQLGLAGVATGLNQMAEQLELLSLNMDPANQETEIDFSAMTSQLNNLVNAQNQLSVQLINLDAVIETISLSVDQMIIDMTGLRQTLENDPAFDSELQMTNLTLSDLKALQVKLDTLSQTNTMAGIPAQTSQALQMITSNFDSIAVLMAKQSDAIAILSSQFLVMSESLLQISSNLLIMGQNFDAFEPGFPQNEDTLRLMLFDQSELRPPFHSFMVNDQTIRMVIILNGDITDQEIDQISQSLSNVTKANQSSDQVLISGKPILDISIKSSMTGSMQMMMISAVVTMVLILLFFYRVRFKLLPIFMIMIAVVATIGVMGWLSIGLTMVSMAVFPVLIGLGIDYFIQFQTRYEEERRG